MIARSAPHAIDRFCVVAPTPRVLAAFNQSCQPWYDRIVATKREARTLAALRDALLPKLISGELRVNVGGLRSKEKTR